MTITLEQAKSLRHGQELYCDTDRNSNGTPVVWRVNGKVKTWKRDAGRIQVPIKHGFYDFGYLTEHLLDTVHLSAEDAMGDDRYVVNVQRFKAHKRVDVKDLLSSDRWRFKFNLTWNTSLFRVSTYVGLNTPVLFYDRNGTDTERVLSEENRL